MTIRIYPGYPFFPTANTPSVLTSTTKGACDREMLMEEGLFESTSVLCVYDMAMDQYLLIPFLGE
jgi:hypothetical protein